jgi:hypothetical protein
MKCSRGASRRLTRGRAFCGVIAMDLVDLVSLLIPFAIVGIVVGILVLFDK